MTDDDLDRRITPRNDVVALAALDGVTMIAEMLTALDVLGRTLIVVAVIAVTLRLLGV